MTPCPSRWLEKKLFKVISEIDLRARLLLQRTAWHLNSSLACRSKTRRGHRGSVGPCGREFSHRAAVCKFHIISPLARRRLPTKAGREGVFWRGRCLHSSPFTVLQRRSEEEVRFCDGGEIKSLSALPDCCASAWASPPPASCCSSESDHVGRIGACAAVGVSGCSWHCGLTAHSPRMTDAVPR